MHKLATKLVLARDLSPEGRPIAYRGRIREAFGAIGSNMGNLVKINLLCMVFALPLLVILFIYMSNYEASVLKDAGMHFSGGLGLGYGVVDDTARGIETVYGIRQLFVLCSVIPGCMIASVGFAGAYHCCRNVLWGAKVNVLKHFLRGIRNHWYKFLISFTIGGALVTGFVYSLFELMKDYALHVAPGALPWVGVVLCGLGALLLLLFVTVVHPLFVQYRFRYVDAVRNACILLIYNILLTLVVSLLLAAPMALAFIPGMQIVIYIFVLLMGPALWIVFNLAYGQFLGDNFIGALYEQEQINRRKEQERLVREQNRAKKAKAVQNKGGRKHKR